MMRYVMPKNCEWTGSLGKTHKAHEEGQDRPSSTLGPMSLRQSLVGIILGAPFLGPLAVQDINSLQPGLETPSWLRVAGVRKVRKNWNSLRMYRSATKDSPKEIK